jgi:hypothetical protein
MGYCKKSKRLREDRDPSYLDPNIQAMQQRGGGYRRKIATKLKLTEPEATKN